MLLDSTKDYRKLPAPRQGMGNCLGIYGFSENAYLFCFCFYSRSLFASALIHRTGVTLALLLVLSGAPSHVFSQDCGGVPCNEVYVFQALSDQADPKLIGFTTYSREPTSYLIMFDQLGDKQSAHKWTNVDIGYGRCRPAVHLRQSQIQNEPYVALKIRVQCESVDLMADGDIVERLRRHLQTVICREIGCSEDVRTSDH